MMVSEVEGYGPDNYLTSRVRWFHNTARKVYDERLAFGVAREQARKDLPLSTYTEAYWKIDLHNLFHFLRLRMDGHAQLEIRTFANAIGELVKPVVPWSWEAFLDYRFHAMQLSSLEVEIMRSYLSGEADWREKSASLGMSKRERDEFYAKAPRLGINFDEPRVLVA
jgi:thymidylate synthase (FAD)